MSHRYKGRSPLCERRSRRKLQCPRVQTGSSLFVFRRCPRPFCKQKECSLSESPVVRERKEVEGGNVNLHYRTRYRRDKIGILFSVRFSRCLMELRQLGHSFLVVDDGEGFGEHFTNLLRETNFNNIYHKRQCT